MKTIRKSIALNASKEKVWDVLTQDKYTRDWLSAFSPGSHAISDWQQGSKIVFADDSGYGVIGRIVTHDPYELLSMEYYGVIKDNIEDFESKEAQVYNGTHETYRLTSKDDKTVLDIESDIADDSFDSMSVLWDKAVLRIEKLAQD